MRDFSYRRPWENQTAQCPACGSTAVFTDRDQPEVDTTETNKLYPIGGGPTRYIGTLIFWKPCMSCRDRLEWCVSAEALDTQPRRGV
jgi:hypothetical protein